MGRKSNERNQAADQTARIDSDKGSHRYIDERYIGLLDRGRDSQKVEVDKMKDKDTRKTQVISIQPEVIKEAPAAPTFGTLGSFIRHQREEQGITLARLSEISGVSASYILRIEKGERKQPSISVIERLAKALNTPISSLVTSAVNISAEKSEVIPLSELIFANPISLRPGGPALTGEEKSTLVEIVEFLGKSKWNNDKYKDMGTLMTLVDKLRQP